MTSRSGTFDCSSCFKTLGYAGNMMMGGLSTILERAYPDLQGRRDFYDQVWRELYGRGLVTTEGLHTTMSAQGLASKRTTDRGDRFLAFIAPPNVKV
jgi:hypothetical protein